MNDIAFEFVKRLGAEISSGDLKLPAFPDIAIRVKQVLESEDVSADKVAKVVGSAPVLSARLLKVANSSFANRSGTVINDLHTAIARLGYDFAYSTAVSLAIEQIFYSKSVRGIRGHLKTLWRHSVHVSAIAYVVAKNHSNINPDEAMLAGLLHDIGKFYVLTRAKEYPQLFSDQQVLDRLLAQWHTGIGHAILEAWGFSEDIANMANDHEDLQRPRTGPPDLTDIVIIANLCANFDQLGDDFDWFGVSAMQRLRLNYDAILEILKASADEVHSIVQVLSG
jgi:putative nucleotidyltransferase with HDIG domain